VDPDPDSEPYVFGPPGSGSSKISKKNLDSYCFVTFYDFLSFKNVNVSSKSKKAKI
jgi:hypothetical protein